MSLRLCTTALWFTQIACSYAACGHLAVARRAGFVPQGSHFGPFLVREQSGVLRGPRIRLAAGCPLEPP